MWLALAPKFHTQADRLGRLATLSVPTRVIVGENDSVMFADCERLAATIPGAGRPGGGLAVIPGAGHSPHADNFEAWADALTGFLESLPAAAAVRSPGGG
jgi:pimeloyl-ACP methyl ester carboxylesterase